MPIEAAYDDLLYKVFEASDALAGLREAYPTVFATTTGGHGSDTTQKASADSNLTVLLAVVARCRTLLAETNNGKGISASAGPKEVGKVLRAGYDSLQAVIVEQDKGPRIQMMEAYRESEWRGLVKRIGRQVVVDARAAVTQS
jgi:hypothetical protein